MSPAGRNIAETWIIYRRLYCSTDRHVDALRELNDALGTHYTHSRLAEWQRGAREPNRAARVFMLREVLSHLSEDTAQDADTLCAALT
jgi:hypothetical protein